MSKSWLKTSNDNEIKTFSFEFGAGHRKDIEAGEFWADRIKTFRGEPVARLQLAIQNLPLPGAFRESVIAIRSLIRVKRKNLDVHQDELALLYWLAVIDSFSIPYSEILRAPGYNVIKSIPGEVIKNLSFTYYELGYNKLTLLNATDIKWIVELWGEPQHHSTLNISHNEIWCEYELKLLNLQKDQDNELKKMLCELSDSQRLNDDENVVKSLNI